MASISFAGSGAGLDVPALAEKLVTAKGNPVCSRLDRKEVKFHVGLSAIGAHKSSLSEFQSTLQGFQKMESLQSMAATSDDEGVVMVSAKNGTEEGECEVNIECLVQAQRFFWSVLILCPSTRVQ